MEQNRNSAAETESLNDVFEKINDFIFRIIFKLIGIVKRNKIVFITLILFGFGIGFYTDANKKVYTHNIIVATNFRSVDYFYGKIDLLYSSIKEKDNDFLKKHNIDNSEDIISIKVEPINDLYQFVSSNTKNYELFELMSKNKDVDKIIQDPVTSKNFGHHLIKIKTKEKTSVQNLIQPIMTYLNDSEFYTELKKVDIQTKENIIKQNKILIEQIDQILASVINRSERNSADKLVFYSENIQVNDLLQNKKQLENEINELEKVLIQLDKIVKDKSIIINTIENKFMDGKRKVLYPLFLFLATLIVFWGLEVYKNNKSKYL